MFICVFWTLYLKLIANKGHTNSKESRGTFSCLKQAERKTWYPTTSVTCKGTIYYFFPSIFHTWFFNINTLFKSKFSQILHNSKSPLPSHSYQQTQLLHLIREIIQLFDSDRHSMHPVKKGKPQNGALVAVLFILFYTQICTTSSLRRTHFFSLIWKI